MNGQEPEITTSITHSEELLQGEGKSSEQPLILDTLTPLGKIDYFLAKHLLAFDITFFIFLFITEAVVCYVYFNYPLTTILSFAPGFIVLVAIWLFKDHSPFKDSDVEKRD